MRAYIRENLKSILAVSVILICTGVLIWTNELLAQILPVASEELTLVSCELKEEAYDYTGQPITPEIETLVFRDRNENAVIKIADEIFIQKYIDNTDIGNGSIEVTLEGYQGTFVIKNAFLIRPAYAENLHVTQSTQESIELAWDRTVGAAGYEIYKSIDKGASYTMIYNTNDGDVTTYSDVDVQFNSIFQYYVCAYMKEGEQVVYGMPSDTIAQVTALATPAMSKATNKSYNSNEVQWNLVPGAVGYQVYRSLKKDGEYTCIAEISDGATSSYTDEACECGKTYYYYIKACQAVDEQKTYGKASDIKSIQTKPNRVGIGGKTTDDSTKVTLSWKQSTGAEGYEIYRSVDSTSSYKLIKTVEGRDVCNWSESGLDNHTAYFYRIRPYCVVNGNKVFGSYSGNYEKEAVIEYNYSAGTGVDVLRQYAGRPYILGGTSHTKGWDCSYFVKWTYEKHFGISLPRTSREQVNGGKSVSKNDRSSWQPGDLLFYTENGIISHVAVYLGNGEMIHALNSKYDTLIQGVDYYEKWDKKTTLSKVKRYF